VIFGTLIAFLLALSPTLTGTRRKTRENTTENARKTATPEETAVRTNTPGDFASYGGFQSLYKQSFDRAALTANTRG